MTGDLLQHSPAAHYDVISSRRALHGFSPDDQRTLAGLFSGWLHLGGICIVETLNLWDHECIRLLEEVFLGAGFFIRDSETSRWWSTRARWAGGRLGAKLQEQHERRIQQERENERARLGAGEKMVIFWHGSG